MVTGGKPHSIINVRRDKCVYGVSYKGGVLSALAVDLKGEARGEISLDASPDASPADQVISLVTALGKKAARPLALALALNCEERERVVETLEERLQAKVFLTTNTAALTYRALWKGGALPIVAIGVGNGVKCACLEKTGCRVADLGDLPSSTAFAGEGSYLSLLSAARVERRLRTTDFRGLYEVVDGRAAETRELSSYVHALARAIASLADLADRVYSPREILLFGEYITQGFFDRITLLSRVGDRIKRVQGERAEFAYGAAVSALIEGVFS